MTVTLLRAMKPRSPFRSSERPILTSVDGRSGHPWMVRAVAHLDSRTPRHALLESHDGPDPGARSPRTAPRPARDPPGPERRTAPHRRHPAHLGGAQGSPRARPGRWSACAWPCSGDGSTDAVRVIREVLAEHHRELLRCRVISGSVGPG